MATNTNRAKGKLNPRTSRPALTTNKTNKQIQIKQIKQIQIKQIQIEQIQIKQIQIKQIQIKQIKQIAIVQKVNSLRGFLDRP